VSDWRVVELGKVCSIDKLKCESSNLPYVGMEDIEGGTGRFLGSLEPKTVKSSTFRFTPNHLLYGRLRPYLNKVMLPDFEGHCSSEIFPIAVENCLDRSFLFYWLTERRTVERINRTSTGARMPRANVKEILNFEFPLPPIAEQKQIVAILDEAFEGIDGAIANTERNLANARELFESYLNAIFTRKDDGWVEKKLGEISQRVSVGHVGSTSKFYCEPEDGIPFIRSQNVRPGRLELDDARYVTPEFHKQLKKSQLFPGDLLFVRVGANRGDCCFVPPDLGELNCANIVFARPREGNIDYLEYYCRSAVGQELLLGMTTGSAQGVINTKSVAELPIPFPLLQSKSE
jgi:type I restriction enzyme S subunit